MGRTGARVFFSRKKGQAEVHKRRRGGEIHIYDEAGEKIVETITVAAALNTVYQRHDFRPHTNRHADREILSRSARPEYCGKAEPGCNVGPNFIEGVGGFGATPLLALRDLCGNIARSEGYRTDAGKVLLH